MTTTSTNNGDIENPKKEEEEDVSETQQDMDAADKTASAPHPVKATLMLGREETGVTQACSSTRDNSEAADLAANSGIPSIMDLVYDFNGSLGFVVGSSGFILSLYHTNWLPYFRYGCIVWIWGCLAYGTPILRTPANADDGKKYSCTDVGVLLCLLLFIAGCILGGFFPEEQVLEWLTHINYLFVFGSFSLAIEPLCQAGAFIIRSLTTCSVRFSEMPLCGGNKDGSQLKLNCDRVLELFALSSFCVAGSFGGFGPNDVAITTGVYFWEVGSLFCLGRSILMWRTRRAGLRALGAAKYSKKASFEVNC